MAAGLSGTLGSSVSSTTLTIGRHRSCCAFSPRCCNIASRHAFHVARSSDRLCGKLIRQKSPRSSQNRCRLESAQRCKPVGLSAVGGVQSVGAAGAFAEAPIETIDAVETEALLLPATESNDLLDNTELQRRSLDVLKTIQALEEMATTDLKIHALEAIVTTDDNTSQTEMTVSPVVSCTTLL